MPAARTFSRAPILERRGTFQGRSDSPMWKRGNFSRSKRTTERPARARQVAKVEPAGPPPQMTASTCSGRTVGVMFPFSALGGGARRLLDREVTDRLRGEPDAVLGEVGGRLHHPLRP